MIHEQKLEVIYTELPYWPSVSFLAKLRNVELVFLENCEHFVKSSNRNRCWIAGANGPLLLSIPVQGGRSHKQLYREVMPDEGKSWRHQHWHSLKSAYGKSPFFEYYEADLERFYSKSGQNLWEFNYQLFQWIMRQLGMHPEIKLTQSFVPKYPLNDQRTYRHWQRLDVPPYYQSFAAKTGFLSDMAGLDVLLHLGPHASRTYFKNF